MNELVVLCVEDEPEVRDALARDLTPFVGPFRLEVAESVEDARLALEEIAEDGDRLALALCDHLLPGATGVDLLVELHGDPRTRPARKVLVTAHAGLTDTVTAVNRADLDHYIDKPWRPEELQDVVRRQLTGFVAEQVDDPLPYLGVLDAARLLRRRPAHAD